jgi:hypothetical protein
MKKKKNKKEMTYFQLIAQDVYLMAISGSPMALLDIERYLSDELTPLMENVPVVKRRKSRGKAN